MENILELQQISKTFPKSNFTLDKLSFSLPYGSIMGFVGENGAGKTTTLGCILNTLKKDSGTIKLFGKEMLDDDTDIREKIGVVYDRDNFPGFWTAKQLSQVMEGIYTHWDNALFQKYLEDFQNSTRAELRHLLVQHMNRRLRIDDIPAHQHGKGHQNPFHPIVNDGSSKHIAQRGKSHIHPCQEKHQPNICIDNSYQNLHKRTLF